MYKKCVNCYKDGKVPNEKSCKKCEEDLKAKEQECEKLKNWVKNMMFDTDRKDWFENFVDYFENWKEDLFKQLDQLKKRNNQLVEQNFELAQKYTKLEKEAKQIKQTFVEVEEIVCRSLIGELDNKSYKKISKCLGVIMRKEIRDFLLYMICSICWFMAGFLTNNILTKLIEVTTK